MNDSVETRRDPHARFVSDEMLKLITNHRDPVVFAFELLLSARGVLLEDDSPAARRMHDDVLTMLRRWKPAAYRRAKGRRRA